MTPAVLLVCVAVVTNVNHGTIVNKDCHYAQVNPAGMPVLDAPEVAVNTVEQLAVGARALAVAEAAPEVKPARPALKKKARHVAKLHTRVIPVADVAPGQDRAFRLNWFRRLAGMAKEMD